MTPEQIFSRVLTGSFFRSDRCLYQSGHPEMRDETGEVVIMLVYRDARRLSPPRRSLRGVVADSHSRAGEIRRTALRRTTRDRARYLRGRLIGLHAGGQIPCREAEGVVFSERKLP